MSTTPEAFQIPITSVATSTIAAARAGYVPPRVLEPIVRNYFSDRPQLAEIARCESRFRQFAKDGEDGEVIRGVVNSADVGVMQINEKYHKEQSIKLGYDIYTLEGNMAYARYLYDKEGSQPWSSSSPCWNKYKEIAKK